MRGGRGSFYRTYVRLQDGAIAKAEDASVGWAGAACGRESLDNEDS